MIFEIAAKCMKFEPESRCEAENVALMAEKLKGDVTKILSSQD